MRDQKDAFDSLPRPKTQSKLAMYPYDVSTPFVKNVHIGKDIGLAIAAMSEVMNTAKGMALDCEWKVKFDGNGKKTEWKIGLIQLAYYNNDPNIKQYLLIRTHQLKKLPSSLVSLLSDNSINVVGVNVGGDIARIGRDFGLVRAVSRRRASTVISLGLMARKRDVVPSGNWNESISKGCARV